MSAGGVFKLIANDGKPDKVIVATALLNQRMKDVACARNRLGKDPTPTLLDIEKTHILFVNAHFKPFAAVGYEYNKVRPSSGTSVLGGQAQFSIPQFGDFFHDMVLRVLLSATYANSQTAPTNAAAAATTTNGKGLNSIMPLDADDWNADANAAVTYSLVDAFGTPMTEGTTAYRNMVRYVEYPAERLCAKVQFDVNGNPLDEYTHRVAAMLRKFTVFDEKLVGYKRLVGQEVPFEGYSGPRVCNLEDGDYSSSTLPAASGAHGLAGPHAGSNFNVASTPAAWMSSDAHSGGGFASNQWTINAATSKATASVAVNVGEGSGQVIGTTGGGVGPSGAAWGQVQRELLTAVDGPQTPKYWQGPLELWNPLHFWFNKDARLSVPSVAIPYGQRFITIDFATSGQLVADFPGCFVQQDVINRVDADAAAAATGTVYRNYRPYWTTSTITAPTMSNLELYINNIFVNPEVHDIFIRRVGFSLIRVYRTHTSQKTGSEDQELLSQLKWPIECLFLGFQPTHNTSTTTNSTYYRDWHRMGKTMDAMCEARQSAVVAFTSSNAANAAMTLTSNIGQIVPDSFLVERPVVSTVSLTAHGIKIHDSFPQAFFSTYKPFHYGDTAVRPPKDVGAMMINFSLFTGCYQPSGYLNTSRARELYVSYVSTYIGANTPVTLIAVGIAINFLLISDGSAVLRYST